MSRKCFSWIVSGLLVISSNVFAVDCEKASTTVEMNECASIAFKSVDKQLNQTYKKLYNSLNEQEKKVLKDSQNAWIDFRDKNANLMSLPYLRASMYTMVFLSAKTDLTQARIKELEGVESENLK